MYTPAVLDHFKNPRNAGEMEGATARVEVSNPVCGDVTELAVRAEEGHIAAVRFRTRGCVAAIACASHLTEMMEGKPMAGLAAITPEALADSLGGLPPASFHAAQLSVDALRELLARLR
jgi:NifU-like protein involved in Fe-S cluster formation